MSTVHSTTHVPGTYRQRMTIRGHELHADLTKEEGGDDTAPGAHDYFDASLAACKALTAMWYAKKNGFPLEGVDVDVVRDDSEERKGRYKLTVSLTFHGPLDDEQKKRISAAAEKCPVSKLMRTTEVVFETV